jgi:Amiloride-sensitive sodium channel
MQYPEYETETLQLPPPWKADSPIQTIYLEFFDLHENYSNNFEAKARIHAIIHPNDEFPSAAATHVYFWNQRVHTHIYPHQVLLDDDLKHESPELRNCFFKHEKSLRMFRIYSKENCEHECQSFAFAQSCGCVPFYLISEIIMEVRTKSSTKILFSGSKTDKVCTFQEKNCSDEVTSSLDGAVAKCRYLSRCEMFEYDIKLKKETK